MSLLNSLRDKADFFKGFVKDPLSVGSVVPSSRSLARDLISTSEFQKGSMTVEIGPGTGAVTDVILKELPPGSHYLGVDLDEKFVAKLRQKYPQGHFLCDSAENLPEILKREGLPPVDFLISGLPWSVFSEGLQKKLLKAIWDSLSDSGEMTTFVYLHMLPTPLARRFLKNLRNQFPRVERTSVVFRNFPAAAVFRSWKK